MGNRKRTSRNPDRARLIVAVAFSITLHALLAVTWVAQSSTLNQSDNPNKAQTFVRFGIEQSQHQTIAWLGFINPTPHQAALSTTDQSALSPEISQAQPSESAASAAVAARFVEAGSAAKASISRLVNQSQIALIQLLDSAVKLGNDAKPTPAEPNEAENTDEQAEPPEPTNQPEPTEPAENESDAEQPTQPANEKPPAIKSPKESDAVSRDKVLKYKNGKVASRQGLDIKTVKPKWVDATLLTANPRNPTVRIEFKSNGKVKEAYFEGIGSGYDAVDHVLLNAIYAWTASGKEIDDLKESDPEGVVIARVRIRLR